MAQSKPLRSRNQFKRWLIWYLQLPVHATFKEIQDALLLRLEGRYTTARRNSND